MNTSAPDVYPVDGAQLAEEMKHIAVASPTAWGGASTVITGVRHYPGNGPQPILILKSGGRDPIHLEPIRK